MALINGADHGNSPGDAMGQGCVERKQSDEDPNNLWEKGAVCVCVSV